MERINEQELKALVNRPTETRLTKTQSLPESSAVMLAGMLHMAAAQSKTTLTPAESAMWARQVRDCSPEVIEQFFTEWMETSHYMPQFADFTDWLEARSVVQGYKRASQEYQAYHLRHDEEVRRWRESPEYEQDMAEIRKRLEPLVAKSAKSKKPAPEIPLAFSPEEEQKILAEFVARKGQQ